MTVGDVSATRAVVWARPAAPGLVTVEARPASGGPAITAAGPTRTAGDAVKLALDGLAPATRYGWRTRAGAEEVAGEFVTAPAPERAAPLRFLWSGDLGGGGFCRPVDGGYPIFRAMARLRPDFFLFEGDTIYADVKCDKPGVAPGADFVARSLGEFRRRYVYNREGPAVRAFFGLTSVYAIWDDHEVRADFSGPDDRRMPTGRRAFLESWPILPPGDEPTRLYRKFRWGRLLELFILDTRQYRSPNAEPDGPRKTMLGAAQRRWLVDGVATSGATWKVVVSSVPLSIPTGTPERRDSWTGVSAFGLPLPGGTGFATERDAILRELRHRGVKNLVFLAADVHHAEVIRHQPAPGWTFHELVAGPLSASFGRPRPLDEALDPRSLFARGGVNNFGEIAIDEGRLVVRLLDEGGAVLFTHSIAPE